MGYVFLLKKLAYVCFLGRKFSEAEKYLLIVVDLIPKLTKNPVNLFASQKNLVLFYTYTNLEQAIALCSRLEKD